jgi:hypothetical protein
VEKPAEHPEPGRGDGDSVGELARRRLSQST